MYNYCHLLTISFIIKSSITKTHFRSSSTKQKYILDKKLKQDCTSKSQQLNINESNQRIQISLITIIRPADRTIKSETIFLVIMNADIIKQYNIIAQLSTTVLIRIISSG